MPTTKAPSLRTILGAKSKKRAKKRAEKKPKEDTEKKSFREVARDTIVLEMLDVLDGRVPETKARDKVEAAKLVVELLYL